MTETRTWDGVVFWRERPSSEAFSSCMYAGEIEYGS
jgi:hypothetical protein